MNFVKHFWKDIVFTVVALFLCFLIGGPEGALTGLILGVLEISVSFDNAIVNAAKLKTMDEKWRRRFINWGMPIAIFGMRLVFPILIVSCTAKLGIIQTAVMAVEDPGSYAIHLERAHIAVMGFGGAYLMMLFWKHFIDSEKDEHWLAFLEKRMTSWARIEGVQVGLTIAVLIIFAMFLPEPVGRSFLLAGVFGVVANIVVEGFGTLVGSKDAAATVAKQGFAGFVWLEVTDAAFSFDGVIGSFAISNNIFIIMLGLGIGAFAVRSLTLLMVEKDTLAALPYLESSAYWAIGVLSLIMFVSTLQDIPEIVTGLIGGGIILAGITHSILENRSKLKLST